VNTKVYADVFSGHY